MDYKGLVKFLHNYKDTDELADLAVLKDLCGDAAIAIETLISELDAMNSSLRGTCSACKHFNKFAYFAERECATCKYAFKTMKLNPNNTSTDKDNWEWSGSTTN